MDISRPRWIKIGWIDINAYPHAISAPYHYHQLYVTWFLGVTKHLHNWLCPLVGLSVGLWRIRTFLPFLAYLALFYPNNMTRNT